MLMPSTDVLPFEACRCASQGDPSAWFHEPHCPVCIEYWQHQTAACQAVDDAMEQEREATINASESWLSSGYADEPGTGSF